MQQHHHHHHYAHHQHQHHQQFQQPAPAPAAAHHHYQHHQPPQHFAQPQQQLAPQQQQFAPQQQQQFAAPHQQFAQAQPQFAQQQQQPQPQHQPQQQQFEGNQGAPAAAAAAAAAADADGGGAKTAAVDPIEVRWSWTKFPTAKLDATRMVMPLGCMFSPIAGPAPEVKYAPLKCTVCSGYLNCFAPVDHRSKTWQCPLCTTRNTFPPQYANMSETQLPIELTPSCQTVEYIVPSQARAHQQPVYVLLVDACSYSEEEHAALKEVLRLTVEKLPQDARVALITFSATVRIHELVPRGAGAFTRSVVFRGSTEVTPDMLKASLKHGGGTEHIVARLSDVELELSSAIDDLAPDQWPVMPRSRPLRCTGAAVSAATSLLELTAPKMGSCVLAFLSGAATEGPGQVADMSKAVLIRGHNDLRESTPAAKYFNASTAFYDGLMRRLVKNGHALHVLMANLDQCGLAEMRAAVQATGGVVVHSDMWTKAPLRSSIMRMFPRRADGSSATAMNATIEVVTSPSWKVAGAAGLCVGTGKRSPCIAEGEIGMGGTCQWTTSSMDYKTSFAFFFDCAVPAAGTAAPPRAAGGGTVRYVQFVSKFEFGDTDRVRITTLSHVATENINDFKLFAEYFDQEAAAVLLARLAVLKADAAPDTNTVMSWLDRLTINFVKRFGDFVKNQPQSLKLSQRLSMFPLFVFHLRRSPYLQVFNSSPDETALYRLVLLKAPTNDVAIMIHPTLFSYTMEGTPGPVPLDTTALQPDAVLLLDTFFEIVVYLNESIAAWKQAGYEEQPEYAYFKEFLDGPRADAEKLAADRFPAPRVIECVPNDGQDRLLKNRVNPSKPPPQNSNVAPGQKQGTTSAGSEASPIFTDDASWQSFLTQLKKVAVQA